MEEPLAGLWLGVMGLGSVEFYFVLEGYREYRRILIN